MRVAERRPAFPIQAVCVHAACRERAHLEHVANYGGDQRERLQALTFLNMLIALDRGVYGGVSSVEQLFD